MSPPSPPPAPAPAGDATLSPARSEGDSLLPFAMPLLQLLARLRTLRQADPAALRDRTAAALQSFEARALAAGRPADQVRRAHYALCDSLDDAVLNTPWGAGSRWAASGMVAAFHPAVGPGRFFDALRQAEGKVDTMRPVLEVMVLCLSLGTLGPFRDQPDGPARVEALRQAASAALLAQGPAPGTTLSAALSERWAGVAAPFRRRRPRLPLWVAAAGALAVAAGLFTVLSLRTNDAGDAAFAQMLALPPAQMPALARDAAPPPAPPPQAGPAADPTATDRLRTALSAPLAAGSVVLAGTAATPVLRLPERALFAAGSARLLPAATPLLAAIAEAVRAERGPVRVLGYSDDRPVRTVLFPSAFKLSAARAEAVRAALAPVLGPGAPIGAEGRAGADPVASNGTAEGREQNRRVELLLEGAPQ